MFRILIAGAALSTSLAGCVSYSERGDMTVVNEICDVVGLEPQLTHYRDASNSIRGAAAYGDKNFGAAIDVGRDKTDVTRDYELRQRMNTFDAEVDASYRMVTSSCKAFQRCMEETGHNERRCANTMMRWQSAEARFKRLATDLRKLEKDAWLRYGARPAPAGY